MQVERKPMTREMYLEKMDEIKTIREQVQKDDKRLGYHLQPPVGWLNDPNGLCQIGDSYHIYFQYAPFNPYGGTGLWGHMTTRDFIHYEEQEPIIYPDCNWDRSGAYSGCAYEENGTYYFYYTGNVKYTDREYDYITAGREQNVILISTKDGFRFTPKRFLMGNQDFPQDMSLHVRDPQVFKKDGVAYMLLGARELRDKGCVLLFESRDLVHWKYKLRFTTETPFGYMWECPNYVEPQGQGYLICCPQGVEKKGLDYANVHQCGYFPLTYAFGEENYQLGAFRQLDRGFDFYAPQAFRDSRGRTILLGWMGLPDCEYDNKPTVEKGWQHALTLPRELVPGEQGKLLQKPLEELKAMRGEKREGYFYRKFQWKVPLLFELQLFFKKTGDFSLRIRENAWLEYRKQVLSLDMSCCGRGRTTRGVKLARIEKIHIFSDSSSLEIFINQGEEVFTTRIYDSMENLQVELVSQESEGRGEWYELRP